jgi:triosephosphate isomerase
MRPFFGANWKMNGTWPSGMAWMQTAKSGARAEEPAEMVLFPPFTLLTALAEDAREAGLQIGAQDVYFENSGAFTGEISPSMILEAGCTWAIAGHSERRHILGESDRTVERKLVAALEAGLGVVLCVGELGSQRDAGEAGRTVTGQLESALGPDLAIPEGKLVIAYEPVWAIGTGRIASPAEAREMHSLIRGWLGSRPGGLSETVRVIYGGSVKPENSASVLCQPDVDGALVGGASLDAGSFLSIVRSVTG